MVQTGSSTTDIVTVLYEAKDKLAESIRQFDEKMKLEWAKHKETQLKNSRDAELKQKQINKQKITSTK